MKRKVYMFVAAFAVALAGCTDDELIDNGVPVETGDAIMFASMLNGDQNAVDVMSGTSSPATRTVYGKRTETGIPVHWKGGDQIAIFCPQASAPDDRVVNYEITPGADPTHSATMTTDAAGLQWGTENVHKFFGIYPASIVKTTDADDQKGIITASLPSLQQPVGWRMLDKEHLPEGAIRENVNNIYFGAPNMQHAFMCAYTAVAKDTMTTKTPISLKFENLVTVLDIVIQGPETGEVTVTNVNVEVVQQGQKSNTAICGDFNINVEHFDEDHKVNCKPIPSDKVTNLISIPCYDNDKKQFITLKPKDLLIVKAFIIPDTEAPEYFRQFRITVASLNGSANRMTLNRSDLGKPVDRVITPHKINRILLPKVKLGDPAYWMSNLDPNIYVSELSIPGSKMSYLTKDNGAQTVYQTKTISEQFKDGVRAFIVQTGAHCNYTRELASIFPLRYEYNFIKNSATIPVFGLNKQIDIKTTLQAIAAELQKAQDAGKKNDFAVVMLTADLSGVSGNYVGDAGHARAWIESIKDYLPRLAQDPELINYIYKDEVTPNTTIADVGGKIIIKVNYNYEDQRQWTKKVDKIPALFTMWTAPAADYKLLTEKMYWGWTGIDNPSSAQLNWTYQEVTNIGASGSEATLDTKVAAIKTLFQKGVDTYEKDSQHMNWFMNDLGGKFVSDSDIPLTVPSTVLGDYKLTEAVAYYINTLAVDELQKRRKNASTGLVFMNFADRGEKQSDGSYKGSGAKVKSDYVLATIIDNNFKFALRKKGSTSGQ